MQPPPPVPPSENAPSGAQQASTTASPLEFEVLPPGSAVPPPPAWKRYLGPLVFVGILLLKFGSKLKFVIAPALKFIPAVLKTGSTMLITIGVYATIWGWKYALGFVLLILVHEMGHVIAAKKFGVAASAPMFIPFLGAFIALKEAPKNAVVEAEIGIAGPEWGTFGAIICHALGLYLDMPLLIAIAWSGYWLNLFNLIPVGQLDGGHVAQAISPWLWVPGFGIALWLALTKGSFILWLIILLGIPRIISLFRPKTEEHQSFHDVPVSKRWLMTARYFGLIAFLALAMDVSDRALQHIRP